METPIQRKRFLAQDLLKQNPPHFHHPNKALIYELACPAGCVHRGALEYSRWGAMALPERFAADAHALRVEVRPGVFTYEDSPAVADCALHWHLNFACSELFCAYGGSLMAQDELQVAEHPALAALREALQALRLPALTVDREGPTPILIAGVERRCAIDTSSRSAAGMPGGIYGHAFAGASSSRIRAAVRPIEPPTVSNILAMEAPAGGCGVYGQSHIDDILTTAWSGFRATVLETRRMCGESASAVLHTGFWGCGAYGGNRELMSLLQLFAALLADVKVIVFHTVTPAGVAPFEAGKRVFDKLLEEAQSTGEGNTADWIRRIVGMRYPWGESNGT
jgi:hypothetical protein